MVYYEQVMALLLLQICCCFLAQTWYTVIKSEKFVKNTEEIWSRQKWWALKLQHDDFFSPDVMMSALNIIFYISPGACNCILCIFTAGDLHGRLDDLLLIFYKVIIYSYHKCNSCLLFQPCFKFDNWKVCACESC